MPATSATAPTKPPSATLPDSSSARNVCISRLIVTYTMICTSIATTAQITTSISVALCTMLEPSVSEKPISAPPSESAAAALPEWIIASSSNGVILV